MIPSADNWVCTIILQVDSVLSLKWQVVLGEAGSVRNLIKTYVWAPQIGDAIGHFCLGGYDEESKDGLLACELQDAGQGLQIP